MQQQLSEQEVIRREKLQQLTALGIDPYPAATYDISHLSNEIKEQYKESRDEAGLIVERNLTAVSLAGRIMMVRDMGKACFAELKDSAGRIQIYVRRDDICPGEDKTMFNPVFTKLLDMGDFIGVKGFCFLTKTGELTVHVTEFTILSKTLRVLPVVKTRENEETGETETYDAFSSPELRYRMRYVDLVVNDEVKKTFLLRSKMVRTIRDFLDTNGAIEVDTPVLQNIPGGAAARPFVTHHNALDIPMYMRIANELYLKRLIVGGFDFVYEFSRNFRNEGIDRTHNPEFTVLEFYVAYKDYFWMMDFTEQLLEQVCLAMHGTTEIQVGDKTISFKAPFARLSICDAILQRTGIDISEMDEAGLRGVCAQLNIHVDANIGKGKLIDEIFGETSEKSFIQPTFIMDYPVEMSPLTKKHRSKAGLVERFELMINGKEVANAYSELNDPIDQMVRFEEQAGLMERGDDEAMFIDHDFVRALEFGMPPTAGIGIGIDRLAMLMTNQVSIQEVLFFPQMRPES
jgi:lysyl-tRNA synthetase, class II